MGAAERMEIKEALIEWQMAKGLVGDAEAAMTRVVRSLKGYESDEAKGLRQTVQRALFALRAYQAKQGIRG